MTSLNIEQFNNNNNLYEEYFRLHKLYSEKYGISNTILFLQVGHFYEAYQTNNDGFDLKYLSDIIDIVMTKKNKSIDVSIKNPYMLGFPCIAFSKNMKILIDHGFTVVIGDQITEKPNIKRGITGIYSPGTYLEDNTIESNNILSIYIEEFPETKANLIIGLSVIDLTTGKSTIHEIYSIKDDEKICLDETIRFMYSNQTKEIIITTNNLKENKLNDIINYLEISDKLYHHQTITQMINAGKRSIFKLSYQQELLKKVYPNTGLLTPIEYLNLERLIYGRLSFIILLNYAYDHSHNIISNIAKPELYSENKYLNLGNNAIFQLNLLTFDKNNITNIYNDKTKYKSLFDVINKTTTPLGRRLLKHSLSQPLVNINQIQKRYNFISYIIKDDIYLEIEKILIGINDIEKLSRKINLSMISPMELYNWIQSTSNTIDLFNYIYKLDIKLEEYDFRVILIKINNMLSKISKIFDIEELQKYLLNEIDGRIFKKGIYKDVDLLITKINTCANYMEAISWGLSDFLDKTLKSKNVTIKIKFNEKKGHFLLLTKRRADVLEQMLKKNNTIKFEYAELEYILNKDDLIFEDQPKGSETKIYIKEFEKNSLRMIEYQDELKMIQKKYYINFLSKLWFKHGSLIDTINTLIATIDFLKSGAKLMINNHYTLPNIKKIDKKSYFKATQLRHPIIELLNTDTEYIPTDIELGTNKQDGILLFGLNSAGKSSLQKSIGIAIIMAQMGYPVASKEFEYYPYNTLFTRISANDNIFKGLSSFALEISELRAIIKRSNENTLVIADEVCKGTEHKSSLIIVTTMLEILSQRNTSFITATHLHDLVNIERLNNLKNIKLYHLHVEYDEKNNTIVYDRQLKLGSGDNFYGLNVAKFLIADDNFIKLASNIKKDVFEIPDLVVDKKSNYNSELYMDKCQICEFQPKKMEIPLETHHITFQKDFINGVNADKFHIKKNQKSNLVVLCSKCHDLIDQNKIIVNGWIESNNNKLDWEYIDSKYSILL
jgi:DNA mismatch repair protein MutS